MDSTGNIYWASIANAAIRVYDPTNAQVANAISSLSSPLGVAVDTSDNLYYSDMGTLTVGVKYANSATGSFSASFVSPNFLAVDSQAGRLYVADGNNNPSTSKVYVFDTTTRALVATYDGGSNFNTPAHAVPDGLGNMYVTDAGFSRLYKVVLSDGTTTQVTVSGVTLNHPMALIVDASSGYIMIANQNANTIVKYYL